MKQSHYIHETKKIPSSLTVFLTFEEEKNKKKDHYLSTAFEV